MVLWSDTQLMKLAWIEKYKAKSGKNLYRVRYVWNNQLKRSKGYQSHTKAVERFNQISEKIKDSEKVESLMKIRKDLNFP